MSERTLQALRGRINARLQTSAISRDRASAAGREVVAQCRQSDVETLEWVLSEIDAALATAEPSGEDGGDSTDCPTCGDELAVYWEEGRIRSVVSLDQPARDALLRTPRGEGETMDADEMWFHWSSGHESAALLGLRTASDDEAHRFLSMLANWQRCPKPSDHDARRGEEEEIEAALAEMIDRLKRLGSETEARATVREAIRAARRGEGGGE